MRELPILTSFLHETEQVIQELLSFWLIAQFVQLSGKERRYVISLELIKIQFERQQRCAEVACPARDQRELMMKEENVMQFYEMRDESSLYVKIPLVMFFALSFFIFFALTSHVMNRCKELMRRVKIPKIVSLQLIFPTISSEQENEKKGRKTNINDAVRDETHLFH